MSDNILTKDRNDANIALAAKDVGGVLYPRNILTDPAGVDLTPLTDEALRAAPVPVTIAELLAVLFATGGTFALGDKGIIALGKRRDTDTAVVADGQYGTFNMDEEGRVKVATKPASYADVTGDITAVQAVISTPVAGGTVTADVSRASNVMLFCSGTFAGINCTFEGSLETSGDTSWFAVQAVRSNANTIELTTGALSASPAYAWEMSVNGLARVRVRATARTSGTQSWRIKLGTYATEPIPAAQVSATQAISGSVTVSGTATNTPATPTASILSSAASTNGTVIKAIAGTIYGFALSNTGAAVAYFKLHNSATITVGTTAVALTVAIPAGGTVFVEYGALGLRYGTGICYSITNLAADTDTTAIAAGQVKVNLSYL